MTYLLGHGTKNSHPPEGTPLRTTKRRSRRTTKSAIVVSPLATFRWLGDQLVGLSPECANPLSFDERQFRLLQLLSEQSSIPAAYRASELRREGVPLRDFARWTHRLLRDGILIRAAPGARSLNALVDWGIRDLRCQQILQRDFGHGRSQLTGRPVDAHGRPLPLLSYPAIQFLEKFDFSGKHIFEFGSGNSTLWWSRRAARVTTVETSPTWHAELWRRKPTNVTAFVRTRPNDLARSIHEEGVYYDVIVVDNLGDRAGPAREAPKRLRPGGLIVLDNSEWHRDALLVLRKSDFLEVNMLGFAPGQHWVHETTLFLHRSFTLRRRKAGLHTGGIPPRTMRNES